MPNPSDPSSYYLPAPAPEPPGPEEAQEEDEFINELLRRINEPPEVDMGNQAYDTATGRFITVPESVDVENPEAAQALAETVERVRQRIAQREAELRSATPDAITGTDAPGEVLGRPPGEVIQENQIRPPGLYDAELDRQFPLERDVPGVDRGFEAPGSAINLTGPIAELGQDALKRKREAVQLGVEAEQQANQLKGEEAVKQARAEADLETATQEINARRKQVVADRTQRIDRILDALETEKIDPNRFMANKSTGQKIAMALDFGLSGALAAAQGRGGENPAVETTLRLIDKDIEAQRTDRQNLGRALQGQQNLLNTLTQEFQSEQIAAETIRAAQIRRAQAELQSKMVGVNNQMALARGQEMIAAYEQEYQKTLDNIQKHNLDIAKFEADQAYRAAVLQIRAAKKGGAKKVKPGIEGNKVYGLTGVPPELLDADGGLVVRDDKERAVLREKMTAANDTADAVATLKALGLDRNWIHDKNKAAADQLLNTILLRLQSSLIKGNASDKDVEVVRNAVGLKGNPQKVLSYLSEAERAGVLDNLVSIVEGTAQRSVEQIVHPNAVFTAQGRVLFNDRIQTLQNTPAELEQEALDEPDFSPKVDPRVKAGLDDPDALEKSPEAQNIVDTVVPGAVSSKTLEEVDSLVESMEPMPAEEARKTLGRIRRIQSLVFTQKSVALSKGDDKAAKQANTVAAQIQRRIEKAEKLIRKKAAQTPTEKERKERVKRQEKSFRFGR